MSYTQIISFGLLFVMYHYAQLIVQEKYVNSKFTIITNWFIYLIAMLAMIGLDLYSGYTIKNMLSTFIIIAITVMIIINNQKSMQIAQILSMALLILFALSLFRLW